MRIALLLIVLAASERAATASTPSYLYDARLVQAAPGKLLELIDLYKAKAARIQAAGDEPPLWMRHSQGDRWDLLLLFPMSSYSEYYRPDRITQRARAESPEVRQRLESDIYWQEDAI